MILVAWSQRSDERHVYHVKGELFNDEEWELANSLFDDVNDDPNCFQVTMFEFEEVFSK